MNEIFNTVLLHIKQAVKYSLPGTYFHTNLVLVTFLIFQTTNIE